MKRYIRWMLTNGLSDLVEEAVEIAMEDLKERMHQSIVGDAVEGVLKDVKIADPELVDKMVNTALAQADATEWKSEEEKHREVVELADEWVKKIYQVPS